MKKGTPANLRLGHHPRIGSRLKSKLQLSILDRRRLRKSIKMRMKHFSRGCYDPDNDNLCYHCLNYERHRKGGLVLDV